MSPRPGVSVAKLLGGAAFLGVIAGVALSMRQQSAIDRDLERMYEQGEDLVPPQVAAQNMPLADFMRPDPEALRAIPPYPGANPRRLSSPPTFQNQKFSAAWFSTDDSVDEVVAFYENAFKGLPTPVVSHRFSENVGYAGFYEMPNLDAGNVDVMAGKVHLISAVHSGSQTLVFISNSEPHMFLEGAATLRGDIDLPPNALRPQVVAVGEGPVKKKTIFSVVPASSLEEVALHFEGAFAKGGWKLEPWVFNDDGSVSGQASRKEESSTLMLKREGNDVRLLLSLDSIAVFTEPPTPTEAP